MEPEYEIIQEVYAAKEDSRRADDLIQAYIPFISKEAGKHMGRPCTQQDDEYAIAMMGFYEAILGYEKKRGAFLTYAAMVIRSRVIDYHRKEARHRGHLSVWEPRGEEDGPTLMDTLADTVDHFEIMAHREATRQEITELSEVMERFGVSFSDVADNCPRQRRTLESCTAAIRAAAQSKELMEELLRTGRLPMAQMVEATGLQRKTLERHRKYILAMLLIQTNGFEIIRGHLQRVIQGKEVAVL